MGKVGGNPGAHECLKVLAETWISWAGHPSSTVTDRSTDFKGDFAQYLGSMV